MSATRTVGDSHRCWPCTCDRKLGNASRRRVPVQWREPAGSGVQGQRDPDQCAGRAARLVPGRPADRGVLPVLHSTRCARHPFPTSRTLNCATLCMLQVSFLDGKHKEVSSLLKLCAESSPYHVPCAPLTTPTNPYRTPPPCARLVCAWPAQCGIAVLVLYPMRCAHALPLQGLFIFPNSRQACAAVCARV